MGYFFVGKLFKRDKRYVQEAKRPQNIQFFLGFILCACMLSVFSLHFETRLLHILAETSMIDETDTLTTSDRRKIKRAADKLFDENSLAFVFKITVNELVLPRLKYETFFLNINPLTDSVIIYLPSRFINYHPKLHRDLKICIFEEKNPLANCMETALLNLNEEMTKTKNEKLLNLNKSQELTEENNEENNFKEKNLILSESDESIEENEGNYEE